MGKLLIGRYGYPPAAESMEISLRDCHRRLGMKPSDFVSSDPPSFFKKSHGALGKYIVFQVDPEETRDAAVWQAGYYLLPLEAADVLKVFDQAEKENAGENIRPFEIECKEPVPPDISERASRWATRSQPLLFLCHCTKLVLKLDPPAVLRRHWRARLTCRKRCQPALKTLL